jgi:hypothetical protein
MRGRGIFYSLKVSSWARDFLLSKGFIMGKVDTTLFTKKIGKDLFVLQILMISYLNQPIKSFVRNLER